METLKYVAAFKPPHRAVCVHGGNAARLSANFTLCGLHFRTASGLARGWETADADAAPVNCKKCLQVLARRGREERAAS